MKLAGDHCQCGGCGEYFNSTFSFDAHRVGTYAPNTRRCLSVPEIKALGMTLTKHGWRIIGG